MYLLRSLVIGVFFGAVAIVGCSSDPADDIGGDTTPIDTGSSEQQETDAPPDTDTSELVDTQGTGETCDDPHYLLPYVKYTEHGWGLHLQRENDHYWSHLPSCSPANCDTDIHACRSYNSEIVFSADMKTGQRLVLEDNSSITAFVRFHGDCSDDSDAACVHAHQMNAADFATEYVAPSDGTYYVTFEMESLAVSANAHAYHFNVGLFDTTETSCDDEMDNDGDGLVDCLDEECATACAVTTLLDETFDSELPMNWTVSGAYSSDPSYVTWHWCPNSGIYNFTGPPYCIQGGRDGLKDINTTGSKSGGGFIVYMRADNKDVSSGVYLSTPAIDVAGYSGVGLSVTHSLGLTSSEEAFFEIQASSDNTNWVTLKRFDRHNRDHRRRAFRGNITVDLSSIASTASQLWVRFHYNDGGKNPGSGPYDWQLDDVSIVGGAFEIHGEGDPNLDTDTPEYDTDADGCESGQPKCEGLFEPDLGSCTDSLGWFYNGVHCEEALGCSGATGYCFFPSLEDCVKSCSADGFCNTDVLYGIEWPDPQQPLSTWFYTCTTPEQWAVMETLFASEYTYGGGDDFSYSCESFAAKVTTTTGYLYRPTLTEPAWYHLCAYTLFPDDVNLYTRCQTGGACITPTK